MKFLGVSGVFDYAGLSRSSRYRACSCCLPHITRASASGLSVYGAEYPPRLSSVYASLSTSRYPAQDSRPSGSLLLSRKELSSSASCRFIPAHCNRLTASLDLLQLLVLSSTLLQDGCRDRRLSTREEKWNTIRTHSQSLLRICKPVTQVFDSAVHQIAPSATQGKPALAHYIQHRVYPVCQMGRQNGNP